MSFVMGMIRAQRNREKLVQIMKKASPRPAYETGASECQRSGICCWRRPCDLYPGDEVRLAQHLGLSVQETFKKYLVVDEFAGRLRLLPRRGQQDGGEYLTDSQTFDIDTPCVFLRPDEQNACSVHPAKPTGGASWSCSMSQAEQDALPQPAWTHEALMAIGWDGERDDY